MSYKNSERFTMPKPKDVPRETYESLIKWLSTEDREREMAFAIALYESRIALQNHIKDALNCRSKVQKWKLYNHWKQTMSEEEVKSLVGILKNKQARNCILEWNLFDPRH